jgi:hypothetical protein
VNEEFYISLVSEVFDGYSEVDFMGRQMFIKHFSVRDQRHIQRIYEKYKNTAINRGVETETQILKRLKDDGIWSEEDDLKIQVLSSEIKNLKDTQKNLFIPSQKEAMQKDINNKSFEIYELEKKRREIVGQTAEGYAASRSSQEMLKYFIFDGPDLKNKILTDEEFDELDDKDFFKLNSIHSEIISKMSEENLQHAVLRPFFSMYLSQCENIGSFYGKPVIDLSVYQMKLALFARMFFNIFQNVDDIPDNIRDDPEKLLMFSESQRNSGASKKFIKDDADATAIFGATSEDMKTLTSNKDSGNSVSLSDELKKSGGKLNMEQIIKMAGH